MRAEFSKLQVDGFRRLQKLELPLKPLNGQSTSPMSRRACKRPTQGTDPATYNGSPCQQFSSALACSS
jgi:hypothetical protein